MQRIMLCLTVVAGIGGLLAIRAADPPAKKLTAEERKELEDEWGMLTDDGVKAAKAGNETEAEAKLTKALGVARRLYTKDEFPDGHANLALSLFNLTSLMYKQNRFADARPLCLEAVAIYRVSLKPDNPILLRCQDMLAEIYTDERRYPQAELLYRELLALNRKLHKGNNLRTSLLLDRLSEVLGYQGKYVPAAEACREALEMRQHIFNEEDFPGGHPAILRSLVHYSRLQTILGQHAEGERMAREALAMSRRLFKGNTITTSVCLGNVSGSLREQGKYSDAEVFSRQSLDMVRLVAKDRDPMLTLAINNHALILWDLGQYGSAEELERQVIQLDRAVYQFDHPDRAHSLNNLGMILRDQGKYQEADVPYRESVQMYRRLVEDFAAQATEGEALSLLATIPFIRDGYLSNAMGLKADGAAVYPEVWAWKSAVGRMVERQRLAARLAASNPKSASILGEIANVRGRRADLLLAPSPADPKAIKTRDAAIASLNDQLAKLEAELRAALPVVERVERLAKATPSDLQKALPADAVVVDFLQYTLIEHDPKTPGRAGLKKTDVYTAFVVTKQKISWVHLGPAEPIDSAITRCREAITTAKGASPELLAKVRELTWAKVRPEIPTGVQVVYMAPDLALCRVPWAALPGDKPGTLLLEDYALATISHGSFLLDKLWNPENTASRRSGVLVAGGVEYDAEPRPNNLIAGKRGDLPVKPLEKLAWTALPGAAAEAKTVAATATARKFEATLLDGERADPAAVLTALPRVRVAHFATHGFFADSSFRSTFQVDPKLFEKSLRGERVGAGALSPLVMTGLVFAGANNPKTPGRGILTGESLIDLDLSGLELAVLSACETGLGDVAGGEGVFGLQRAFHVAGTRDVVASLWKVDDAATAALMGEFYANLWERNLPPVQALRRAQLAVYRADPAQFASMARRGVGMGDKKDDVPVIAPGEKTNPPALWAAFTLSGPGR